MAFTAGHVKAKKFDPALRAATGLTLAIYLVGTALSFSHEVTVEHFVCPEHGEIRHAGDHQGTGEAERPLAIVAGAATGEDDGAHDHCTVLGATSPKLPVEATRIAAPHALAALAGHEAPELHGRPTYLLAPKQSPPA